jgi:hypothetical protein
LLHRHLAEKPRAANFFTQDINHSLLDETFSSATYIYICGLTLTRTTRQFMDTFSRRLEAGATIKLAFLDPSNPALMEVMASRSMGTTSAAYWATRLNTVVDVVHAMVAGPHSAGRLEIGFSQFPVSFGLILTDPDQAHGQCFVEIYHHKTAERNAMFSLSHAADPYWFAFFYKQWSELWNTCRIEEVSADRHVTQSHP